MTMRKYIKKVRVEFSAAQQVGEYEMSLYYTLRFKTPYGEEQIVFENTQQIIEFANDIRDAANPENIIKKD